MGDITVEQVKEAKRRSEQAIMEMLNAALTKFEERSRMEIGDLMITTRRQALIGTDLETLETCRVDSVQIKLEI